jgi:hypothetical protein
MNTSATPEIVSAFDAVASFDLAANRQQAVAEAERAKRAVAVADMQAKFEPLLKAFDTMLAVKKPMVRNHYASTVKTVPLTVCKVFFTYSFDMSPKVTLYLPELDGGGVGTTPGVEVRYEHETQRYEILLRQKYIGNPVAKTATHWIDAYEKALETVLPYIRSFDQTPKE